jgi:hypothetical protein
MLAVGGSMTEERPYSLLIRLGVILVPIVTGILLWSYYHSPGSVFSAKPAAVIPAPFTAGTPKPSEPVAEAAAEPAEPVEPPIAAATAFAPAPAVAPSTAGPGTKGFQGIATGQPAAAPGGPVASTAATAPAPPALKQAAPGRERTKAGETRKQEAASAHKTIQKLDKELDRKLSICSGC